MMKHTHVFIINQLNLAENISRKIKKMFWQLHAHFTLIIQRRMKESKGQEIAPHRRKYEIMKFNPHERKLVSLYIKFHAESLQFPVNKRTFFF